MDRRKTLKQFVVKAKRSLNFEKSLPSIQYGLLFMAGVYTAILLISRLFVFPYYSNFALLSSISVLLLAIVYIWWNRVRYHEALTRLDAFYPHNELITALSFKDETNPLVNSILQNAQKISADSYTRFKKRKKRLWRPKTLIAFLMMIIVSGVLYIFPSQTQQEAVVIEKENKAIDELEKEVAKIEKKTPNEEVKKQLQELQNKLKELESSEDALREVVKKQKELKLQEQKLLEKKDLANKGEEGTEGITAEEEEQLKALQEIQSALANSASSTQTALSKLGKSISFDLQNAIAQESGSTTSEGSGADNENNRSDQEGSSGQQSDGQSSQNNGDNQSGNNGSQGQGTNGSQGQGSGSGQGNGAGSGQGQGSGSGSGGGTGGQGSGAGFGQGSKKLLSIPERFGENGETIVDGGPLGNGTAAGEQEGPVPVTKGTIRPYEEVIGQYKDRYMESSERMQLPKDLQQIVQSYFSSIESE